MMHDWCCRGHVNPECTRCPSEHGHILTAYLSHGSAGTVSDLETTSLLQGSRAEQFRLLPSAS